MISITISTPEKVEIKEKKVPNPTYWKQIDKLTCLYCEQSQKDCEFSDTYCYDCGHCSCEKMCLKCNFHSFSCINECSEPDLVEAQQKTSVYTGGHFIHKNEKGEYVHNILCDCDEFKKMDINPPSPSHLHIPDPFDVPLSSLTPDEPTMEDMGFEWDRSDSKQTRIEDYFQKAEKRDEYVPDSWMDYESGSVEEDFRSINDYNVDGIDNVALNNYVLDNLDGFDIEAFLAGKAPAA